VISSWGSCGVISRESPPWKESTHLLPLETVPDLLHPVALEVSHDFVRRDVLGLAPRLVLGVALFVFVDDAVEEETRSADPRLGEGQRRGYGDDIDIGIVKRIGAMNIVGKCLGPDVFGDAKSDRRCRGPMCLGIRRWT
jgi:hypothetical protein